MARVPLWKRWKVRLGAGLLSLSAFLFLIDWLIYRNPDTWYYLAGDIAFIPFSVRLAVTLILSGILERRARRERLQKMNMVIGTFFSTVGTDLLTYFSDHDPRMPDVKKDLLISESWSEQDFKRVSTTLSGYSCDVMIAGIDIPGLKAFLVSKEDFLVRLLENPLLLEHESFTEMPSSTE